MSEPVVWWLMAGAAVAVELLTGTFYLLMLALGLAAAALAAHAGMPVPVQLVVAAVVEVAEREEVPASSLVCPHGESCSVRPDLVG